MGGDMGVSVVVVRERQAVNATARRTTTGSAIQTKVVDLMRHDPESIERALDHLIAARSLERIGDHARNIAEGVIYLVQGIDVRHQSAA